MASSDVSGLNGNVALTGHGGQATAWTARGVQRKKDVSRYGGGRGAKSRGGLVDTTGTIRFFARKGTAGDLMNFTNLEQDGTALVLTADTSCTLSCTALIDVDYTNDFSDPATEGTYDWTANGTVTESWAGGS
jgi:hypothetical protein